MNSNSGRNYNEILTENIQVVSVEENVLEGKILQGHFKVYPDCFYLSLCVLTVQRFLVVVLIFCQGPVLCLKNF